ncbi:MAG: non-homologous end-joining DNA ligase [Verrucomicrobia bacterium]|nr:non-homologous end-joining DNA ligase [Verrucomicrobiota bacterium]
MLPTLIKEPFDSPDWIFEPKLDGYRAIAVVDSTGNARIWSRNHLPLESKFPTVGQSVNKLNLSSTILDGEVVALDSNGIPRFQLLQRWQKRPTAPLVYYLFDVLWSEGNDYTSQNVLKRRERLAQIISPVDGIQVGTWVPTRGQDLFSVAKEKGLEGIVAKRIASTYQPGQRTKDWLKIKSRSQQEFVVGGFTEGKGSRQRTFGALLLGAYRNGRLKYFGHSGSGFSEQGLLDALTRMRPLFTEQSPFVNPPKVKERIQWVTPKLVCEIAYAEWTDEGELRQTTFLGWRDDKRPEEVVLEQPNMS